MGKLNRTRSPSRQPKLGDHQEGLDLSFVWPFKIERVLTRQFAGGTAKARSARARNSLENSTKRIGEPGQAANRCITPISGALDVVRNAANGEKIKRNALPDDTVDDTLDFSVISVGPTLSPGSVQSFY